MPSTERSSSRTTPPEGPAPSQPGKGPRPPHQKEQEKHGPAQTGPRPTPASGNGAATSGG